MKTLNERFSQKFGQPKVNYVFKNQANMNDQELFPPWSEAVERKSKTMPNLSFTIKEIVQRFTKGLPITGEKFPIFDGEEQFVQDMQFEDKMSRVEIVRAYTDELVAITKRQEDRTVKQKQKLEADKERQISELKAKLEALGKPGAQSVAQPTEDMKNRSNL